MEGSYKYISFVETAQKTKTKVWNCCNNSTGDVLGEIKWYASWRQYCFFPEFDTVYSAGCLSDINDFIGKQMQQHKCQSQNSSPNEDPEKAYTVDMLIEHMLNCSQKQTIEWTHKTTFGKTIPTIDEFKANTRRVVEDRIRQIMKAMQINWDLLVQRMLILDFSSKSTQIYCLDAKPIFFTTLVSNDKNILFTIENGVPDWVGETPLRKLPSGMLRNV